MAYNNKAISLSALNKYEKAIECFDKVIELNPDDHKGLYNKGIALFKLQQIPCFISDEIVGEIYQKNEIFLKEIKNLLKNPCLTFQNLN